MKRSSSRKNFVLKAFLTVVLAVSLLLSIISLFNIVVNISSEDQLQPADVFLTKVTMVFTIAAFALLGMRKLWMPIKKNKNRVSNAIRKTYLFFKTRHVLFGWITAAAGVAHSIYFLVYVPEQMIGFWSGLIALVIMIILVVFGYFLDKKAKTNPMIGKTHLWLGIIFFITFVYHFIDSKG